MQLSTALATADTIAGIATLLLVIAIAVALVLVGKYAYSLYQQFIGAPKAALTSAELEAKATLLESAVTTPAETVQKNFLELLMTKAAGGDQ